MLAIAVSTHFCSFYTASLVNLTNTVENDILLEVY